MTEKNGCWCTFKFHLPGEKKAHQQSLQDARVLLNTAKKLSKKK